MNANRKGEHESAYSQTRQAWVNGVKTYYPGDPKPSYIAPWESDTLDERERKAIIALYEQVRLIILPSLQSGVNIPADHGGHLVASIWNILMFEAFRQPKSAYVKHYEELDPWQQKTDTAMYLAIEASVRQEIHPSQTQSA